MNDRRPYLEGFCESHPPIRHEEGSDCTGWGPCGTFGGQAARMQAKRDYPLVQTDSFGDAIPITTLRLFTRVNSQGVTAPALVGGGGGMDLFLVDWLPRLCGIEAEARFTADPAVVPPAGIALAHFRAIREKRRGWRRSVRECSEWTRWVLLDSVPYPLKWDDFVWPTQWPT